MTFAPQTESGNYFNTQERHVRSFQWVESISLIRNWRGEHVVKTGADVQWARFEGSSENAPGGRPPARRIAGGADGVRRADLAGASPAPRSRSSVRTAGASVRVSRWNWGSAWTAIRS